MGETEGEGGARGDEHGHVERTTLCLPNFPKDVVMHRGDEGFQRALEQYYQAQESNASERLMKIKDRLRSTNTHDFWTLLMQEMADVSGAQCAFVSKRMLVDDENTAVEMPELGEPGSCLMGVALYFDDGKGFQKMYHDYKYVAYGTPCAHMRHDKVFVVPEKLSEFVPNNPNEFPWAKSEAYIGVPLFSDGKAFAHFGLIWSAEGAPRRKLSWSFIEMFLHALEDIILQRLLEGRGFAKEQAPTRIIPLDAITASQSLKPYARSLSHELRTPMQGVVGMLDIMHSTVLDAISSQRNREVRNVFETLKANIELVQDSSKRAVEAADNVVHAYDLNMQMPDTALTEDELASERTPKTPRLLEYPRPGIVIEGAGIPLSPAVGKRPRDDDHDFHPGPPMKRLAQITEDELRRTYDHDFPQSTNVEAGLVQFYRKDSQSSEASPRIGSAASVASTERRRRSLTPTTNLEQVYRHIDIRDFMHSLINDAVQDAHPVQKENSFTDEGETILVTTVGHHGELLPLNINLFIEPNVPEALLIDEQHLRFALLKVVDNAIKFTDDGSITITVKVARNPQLVDIRVSDTGCGINDEFKPYLFKPHFQEDASISRAKDGLGLSLFNAKAYVRKNLGGDLTLERSATTGPSKGSEFLIKLPIYPANIDSRPHTPRLGTPTPSITPSVAPSIEPRESRQASPSRPPLSEKTTTVQQPTTPTPKKAVPTRRTSPPMSSRKSTFNRNLANLLPLKFLIAEDNVINRNILVGYLKKLGYRPEDIILAFDGSEAVQQYQASLAAGKHIDAVLMDLWMPNMDGYEATEKILDLAQKRGEELAVMAVTADITSTSLERAKEVGMKGFISKPYKVMDVEHLILEHFRKDNLVV